MASGYSYNTANAGAYGSADLKKKKPAATPVAQPTPRASGSAPNAAPASGSTSPISSAQPVSSQYFSGGQEGLGKGRTAAGDLLAHMGSVTRGGAVATAGSGGIRGQLDGTGPTPMRGSAPARDVWSDIPLGGGTGGGGGGTGVGGGGSGGATEEELDQALQDQLAALLGEGPRSTEEIEGVIGEQMDRSLEDELGRIMAMAGGLGAGRAGSTAVGMGDAARENALARQDAILGAQRDAEKDWLDRLNASAGLYGRELELRSMEDYYRLMQEVFGFEEPVVDEPGAGPNDGDDGLAQGAVQGAYDLAFNTPPGYSFDNKQPPANAVVDGEHSANGVTFVLWTDPATGNKYMSPRSTKDSALINVLYPQSFNPLHGGGGYGTMWNDFNRARTGYGS